MDLPPPPPYFPPPDYHRYVTTNLIHHNHRDFHPHHHPVPPPPPPHVIFGNRFTFSPPHELDLPFPPPNRDYLVRSPNFRDYVYLRDNNTLFDLGMRQRFDDVRDVGSSDWFRETLYLDDVIDRRWDDNFVNRFSVERGFYAMNRRDEGRRLGYEDERRLDYGVNGQGFGLRRNDDRRVGDFGVSDRLHEFYRERVDSERRRDCEVNDERRVMGFDRFSGRLGRRVCDEEVARDSKKRRVQNTREHDRIEVVGKTCSNKRRRGNHFENVSKERNNWGVRRGKGKEVVKRIETRGDDKKEREQSPLELAISFESNGLVARTILTPPSSSSAGKSKMDSMLSKDCGKVNGSLLSKAEMGMVKVDVLKCGLDAESDANGASESNAFESGRLMTNGNDVGEDNKWNGNFADLKAEGAHIVGSRPSDSCRLEETKAISPDVSDIGTTDVTSDVGVTAAANDSLGGIKSQGTNRVGYWRARALLLRKIMIAKKKRLRVSNLGDDKKEREQSPLELAISFESNGLVARTILTPPSSSSAGKSKMDSMLSKDCGKVNGSLLSKAEMGMVKVDVLKCGLDAESDANGASESNAFECGRLMTNENDVGEDNKWNGNLADLKTEGPHIVGSRPSDSCRLEETKATSPDVSDIGTTDVTSNVGVTAAANDSLGGIKSQGTNRVGYWRARTLFLRKIMIAKKKRLRVSNLGATNDSSKIMLDNTGSSSGNPEQDTNVVLSNTDEVPNAVLLPCKVAASKKVDHESDFSMFAKFPCDTETLVSTKDADSECQSGKDEVAFLANEAILDCGNTGDGSVFSKHSDDVNICVPNSDSELNSDNIRLRTDRMDNFMHCPFQDSVYPSSSQELVNFPVLDANCSVLENVEGEGCDRVTSADCSDVDLDTLADSTFMSVEHKGFGSEFNNSVLDTLSHKNSYVQELMEATETSPDHLPEFTRKRKASNDQVDLSSPKTNEHLSTLTGKVSSKDCSSSERVDLPCERNRCEEKESSSKGPSEDGSSYKNLDAGSGVDGLSCKKKKVEGSGFTSLSIDSFHRDQSELDWRDHVPPDCGAGRWKDAQTDSTTAINICDATDIDIKVEEDNLSIADMDNISSHEEKEKMHVNGDELDFVDNLSSGKNVGCNPYSSDEQAESDSDELSCPSSPEDLLLFSDFSSPINTNVSPSLSRKDDIYGTVRTFNRSAVSADRLGKTTSYSVHTNRAIPSPVTFPMVQKSNFTHGKLMMSKNQPSSTASKALTGYPRKCSTPKTLPSTQVPKSKTWRRTGSVAGTTPELKPSLPPQVHTTKMSSPTQNSYVRKGNSLTRTPSPSSAPSPGFHASSSSVYRASPVIDGLKKCQSFKTTVDAPSLQNKPTPSSVISPGFHASSSLVYRASPSIDDLKKSQAFKTTVDAPSLQRKPSPSNVISPGFHTSSSLVYRASPSIDGLKKGQAIVDTPSLPRKPSPSSAISPGFQSSSSSVYRLSPSIAGLSKGRALKTVVDTPSLQRKPSPSNATSPGFHTVSSTVYRLSPGTDSLKKGQTSKNRVDGDAMSILLRKPSLSSATSSGFNALRSSVYRLSPSSDVLNKGHSSNPCPLVKTSVRTESLPLGHGGKSPDSSTCNTGESSPLNFDVLYEAMKSCPIPESRNSSDSQSVLDVGKSEKKITCVKRKSNQLVAASDCEDTSTSAIDKSRQPLSGGYYKSKKNQLVRTSLENQSTIRDGMVDVDFKFGSQVFPSESSRKRQLGKGKGFQKTFRSSKFSFVWKLNKDSQSSEKHKVSERPQKVLSRLFPWKRATYRRSFMLALGSKPNNKPFSISQKLLISRKRGAVYTRSSHGYSLKMSKVFSVGGSSLKWSKSLEKNSKKVNEDATRAVAAAEKKNKEENINGAIVSKTRSRVSRKLVPYIKLLPGERIFRIGSERYKMDSTRRTLRRITAEENASTSSAPLPSEKNVKISYIPRRLFIGSNEYVRIGSGNQLVRDPKKRTRVLASEKVRWSLRTARLSWAKKKKYCQFFTKFGKCNKEDGKCPYIHDQTKIVVCTKFLNGSCSNPDCKLTHKVIPERMQDCSYFLKGSCSSDNCPYRHVNVDPDSPVCESFLRGYCADGNECRKKHTYVCPAFEATGTCLQASTCKLHHPKKKTEKKPATEEKIVRGRYFDGGLIDLTPNSMEASNGVFEKGKGENEEGKFPHFISLDVSDDELQQDTVKASL